MQILNEIINVLEAIAPQGYQESYDNSGLITGHPGMQVSGAVVCLDSTEEVIDEAIALGFNLVIAHHPIIFSGLKQINGKNYIERAVIKAIRHNIAIYAIHTNLDNVSEGVNKEICNRLGLINTRILSPKHVLKKLVTYTPVSHAETVKETLFAAGAGHIGKYDSCSFNITGTGTFRAGESANPWIGKKGEVHSEKEERIELIYETARERAVIAALREAHPYEEIAYQTYSIDNRHQDVGSGMIGDLPEETDYQTFLKKVKTIFQTGCIRYTEPPGGPVKTIAVCGGSGSFLLQDALKQGAQAFLTADFKYHQFFDAEGRIMIADIGHFESEQFTMDLIYRILNGKFPKFALRLTETLTNPVRYF